jgi:trimeric autotransporter adhesin
MSPVGRLAIAVAFAVTSVLAREPIDSFRIVSPPQTVQIRVQILYDSGTPLYDSDWKSGNLLDVTDALPFGSYQLHIFSRDLEGRIVERQTTLNVSADRITIDPALPDDLKLTTTAHDGTTGQIITTSGDLSFRFGDYLNRKDVEAMRLSPEGNLEVKGWIRAGQGILFPDGSLVDSKTAAEKKLHPKNDVAGTGTTNQLTKWTDTVGTLGDSAVSEVSGNVGIATMTPTGKLHIFGAATSDVFAGLGVDMNAGPSFNIGYGGASFGRSAGFFNVRPDAMASAPNPSLRFMTANSERMIITNAGNIGIGTSTPGGRFQIFAPPTADVFAGIGTDMSAGPSFNFGYGGASFGEGAGFFNVRPDAMATPPNPSLRFMTANAERMIITNAGSVGIGTSAPSQKLEIAGNLALPTTAAGGTAGVIYLGGSPFAHSYTNGPGSNTFIGQGAGNFTTLGVDNTGIGRLALANLAATSLAAQNTAVGVLTLFQTTDGHFNTAIGNFALQNNTGTNNIGVGRSAGDQLTTGNDNIDIGNRGVAGESGTIRIGTSGTQTSAFIAGIRGAMPAAADGQGVLIDSNGQIGTIGNVSFSNNLALPATAAGGTAGVINLGGVRFTHSFGTNNTFVGPNAGNFAMSGAQNTGGGNTALFSNTTGANNTGFGHQALGNNTIGNDNTATGANTLLSNTSGLQNTAIGSAALINNTTGSGNIAIGQNAGLNLTTGTNNIDIGNNGVAAESGTIRIGGATQTKTFIAGVSGVTTGGTAVAVVVDGSGQLGTASSSRRYKFDISDMGESTASLMRLRPVTFRYIAHGEHAPLQYGLIAEEVAEVYPDLVTRNKDGQVETVMYQFLAPMLLNVAQKQQRTIDEQQKTIETLTSTLASFGERLASLERRR